MISGVGESACLSYHNTDLILAVLGGAVFIGHYGPAFGAKAAVRRVPLWIYFVAVQWLDVVWSILVMAGVEKVKIVPGFTQGSSLDLYCMPYTHGLIGALILSALFGGVVALILGGARPWAVFLAVFAASFSHWLLDLAVHMPDLWIYDGVKLGFGLWRWLWISLPLELFLLFAGAWLYARLMPARPGGNLWLWLFVLAMSGLEIYSVYGSPASTPAGFAQSALLAYGSLALLAGFVDLSRAKASA
jgi:hypothetical protein